MRDAILAAASEAADAAALAQREKTAPAEATAPDEDIAAREAAARTAGEAEGIKKGSASERARIKAIIESLDAKGREELAHYFAFETDMATDVVVAALAKSPAGKGNLETAMAREAQPKLGAGTDRAEAPLRVISTQDIYARRRAEMSKR
jgi:hypothetical protein